MACTITSSFITERGHQTISGLSLAAKVFARDMIKSHVRPASIIKAVNEKFPDDHPNMRHLYILKEIDRRKAMDGRDVMQQFLHHAREHNYLHWRRQDEETNVMTQAFMVHPQSADILRTYPHVVGRMQCTKPTSITCLFWSLLI